MEDYSPDKGEKTDFNSNNVVLNLAELPQKTSTQSEKEEEDRHYAKYLAPKEVIVNRYIFKK